MRQVSIKGAFTFEGNLRVMAIKVVLYEDNRDFREGLSLVIKATEGYELAGAFENCNAITADLRILVPDVVLMDIHMPGMSGIEAVQLIKKNYPAVEILMLTVFDDEEHIFGALCAGATGYLLKRTPPAKILDAIDEVYNGGAPMTSSVARKVLATFPSKNSSSNSEIDKLSERERDVLQLLAKGMSYKMVAAKLNLSIDTIRTYIRRTYEKLHVHSVTEAIARTRL